MAREADNRDIDEAIVRARRILIEEVGNMILLSEARRRPAPEQARIIQEAVQKGR